MADLGRWTPTPEFWILVGFHVFIAAMLALDLGVLRRRAHVVSLREAAAWSVVWVTLAMGFAFGVWKLWYLWHPEAPPKEGAVKAVEFVTGYLVELSLSVDNLFVFLVIFRYFAVPQTLRFRVLFWGILGAVIMRASFIVLGAALLNAFHWVIYLFGVLLIYTGFKLARSMEDEVDPGKNLVLRLARRFLRVTGTYEGSRFWTRHDGKLFATPLLLVLLVVESTDVVFAVDSIPAIFGITQDTFIVYTSNIFAILGLRALYFLLAGILGMFRYLNVGLALVLTFVGVKMLSESASKPVLHKYGIEKIHVILFSLGTIALLLGGSVVASLIAGPKMPPEEPVHLAEDADPAAGAIPEGPETPDANVSARDG